MIDKLRKRNEQLKIEHEKAVEIVVQGLKDRTKAEALVNSQSEQEETKFAKPVDQKELEDCSVFHGETTFCHEISG